MCDVGTYSSTHYNPSESAFVSSAWFDPLKWGSPACPQDFPVNEGVNHIYLNSPLQSGPIPWEVSPNSGSAVESLLVPAQELAGGESGVPRSQVSSVPSRLKPNQARYLCSTCGQDFAQKQGVTRHNRDVHEVSSCLHCNGFKWHRRYQLKKHLEKAHPDVHVPTALAEATKYRRRTTMTKNRLQGPQYHQRSSNKPLPQPLTPVVSCVAYDPQPELTMPTITNVTQFPPAIERDRHSLAEPQFTTTEYEDLTSGLKHYLTTQAPWVFSEEDFALQKEYHQIHGTFPFPSVYPKDRLQVLGWGQLGI